MNSRLVQAMEVADYVRTDREEMIKRLLVQRVAGIRPVTRLCVLTGI